jgi:hypothetical protein
MRKLLYISIVTVLLAIVIFLLGSFTVASFDINKWDAGGRLFAGTMWFMISLAFAGFISTLDKDELL